MKTQYQQYFYNPKGHEIPLIFCTLENVETVNEFASLFRKDYDKMKRRLICCKLKKVKI